MASRRQKVHQSMDSACATSDLISHLPGDVIVNILLRLPLQEAVKTSLLSKRWRHKWITIPQLLFDSSTFSSASKHNLLTRTELLAIIHQVLFQHEGPISKFMLSVPQLGSCPEIDHLISFLTRKSIEDFTLRILQGNAHKIPSYLFSCLKMRLLCLHQCVLKPPPDFAGFAKLTNLKLRAVDLPASFAETFVAKCPLLECLTLHNCSNLDSVDFYAPNLQSLDYLGRISSVSFKNTPSLKKVSIEHEWFQGLVCKQGNTWIDTFCSFHSLEYLQLGHVFIRMLAAGIARDILASNLNCLAVLVLSGISFRSAQMARCVLCLIKSSPNLQKLMIQVNPTKFISQYFSEDLLVSIYFSKAKDSSEFSFGKLQAIMLSFQGSISEMEFIKLLLGKSPVLETMHIYHLKGRATDQKLIAERKTNQFRRASPRAEVIFHEVDES